MQLRKARRQQTAKMDQVKQKTEVRSSRNADESTAHLVQHPRTHQRLLMKPPTVRKMPTKRRQECLEFGLILQNRPPASERSTTVPTTPTDLGADIASEDAGRPGLTARGRMRIGISARDECQRSAWIAVSLDRRTWGPMALRCRRWQIHS